MTMGICFLLIYLLTHLFVYILSKLSFINFCYLFAQEPFEFRTAKKIQNHVKVTTMRRIFLKTFKSI